MVLTREPGEARAAAISLFQTAGMGKSIAITWAPSDRSVRSGPIAAPAPMTTNTHSEDCTGSGERSSPGGGGVWSDVGVPIAEGDNGHMKRVGTTIG